MKKYLSLLILGIIVVIGNAHTVQAISTAELQSQINNLLKMVSTLQEQLSIAPEVQIPESITIPTQIATPQNPTFQGDCLQLTDDLYYGMRDYNVDGAISKLQDFLVTNKFLSRESVTGFFGPQTMQAIKDFQAKRNVINYGTPDTTGFGRVGPSTRRVMQQLCNTQIPPTLPIYQGNAYLTATPSDSSNGKIIIFTTNHGDRSSYQPSFSDGQDTLIDFGDDSAPQWVQCQVSGVPSPFESQCPTPISYKHEYKTPGTYTARLIRSGGYCPAPGCPIAELARVSVAVGNGVTACTREYAPVCGQPQGCSACPEGAYCTMLCNQPEPRTYSNRCELKRAQARFLYSGKCQQVPSQTNQAPVIESFSGPTFLKVSEVGVWTIEANDRENEALKYRVDWGDQPQILYAQAAPSRILAEDYTQSTTFEHRYTRDGKYTVRITVSDTYGNQTNTSTTVHVESNQTNAIPANCRSWYDGCNTCSRSFIDGPEICTLRACFQQRPSYCKAYFTGTNTYQPVPSTIGIQDTYKENEQNIAKLIQDFNNGNQDFSQVLNQASGFLSQILGR